MCATWSVFVSHLTITSIAAAWVSTSSGWTSGPLFTIEKV
jgi:hypothetical protein